MQNKISILSYKLGLGKSLIGLGLKKLKKPWAWACPKKFSTPASTTKSQIIIFKMMGEKFTATLPT